MSVKVKKLKGSKVELQFAVESEKFDKAIDKAFEKKKETVEVPGFRKGKISKTMYLSRFGVESLYADALDIVMNDEYVNYIIENKLDVCAQPQVDVDWTTVKQGETVKFTLTVAVYPEVTLGEYKGIEVKKEAVKVGAKDVNEFIDRILKQHASLESVEGKALEKGNTAIFDFEGSVNGVKFEGGTATNYTLEIGSGQFIPGFEDQMVGMNIEETKDVVVTFPENYQAKDLAGKEAVFKVTVHEIKKKVLPELTDEFVSEELELENVKTVKDYKEYVKDVITKEKTEASDNKYADDIITKVVKNAKMDLPSELVDEEVEKQFKRIEQQAKMYGMTADMLLKYSGMESAEQYKETVRPSAENQVKERLVFEAIAKAENFGVTDEEYESEIAKAATEMKKKPEELKKTYTKEAITPYIQLQKAYELVKSSAVNLNDPAVKAQKAEAKAEEK